MAVVADWDLLAIDSRQIETESLDFFAALADMPHMVHFHLLWASADSTIVTQSSLGIPWPPSWEGVQVGLRAFGFFHLLQGLIEEPDLSPIGFREREVFAIFLEDAAHRGAFLVSQGLGQRVSEHVAGVVELADIFSQLVVVVPTSQYAVIVFDNVVNGLVD